MIDKSAWLRQVAKLEKLKRESKDYLIAGDLCEENGFPDQAKMLREYGEKLAQSAEYLSQRVESYRHQFEQDK